MLQFLAPLLASGALDSYLAGNSGGTNTFQGFSAPQMFGQRIFSPALSEQNMPSLGTELGPQAKAMTAGMPPEMPPEQKQGALGPALPQYQGPQAPQIDLRRPAGGYTAPQRNSLQYRPTALGGQRWI